MPKRKASAPAGKAPPKKKEKKEVVEEDEEYTEAELKRVCRFLFCFVFFFFLFSLTFFTAEGC